MKKSNFSYVERLLQKKWLTTHIKREHQSTESKPNVFEEPTILANNNRTLLIGPNFSGKRYLMLKSLSRIPRREIYIITKSPPEQFSNSQIKITEFSEEIKHLSEYEKATIVFDDILGTSNSKI